MSFTSSVIFMRFAQKCPSHLSDSNSLLLSSLYSFLQASHIHTSFDSLPGSLSLSFRVIGSKFKVGGGTGRKNFLAPHFSAAPQFRGTAHAGVGTDLRKTFAKVSRADHLTQASLYVYGTISHSVYANEQLGLVYTGIRHITERTRGTNLAILTSFFLQLLCLAWPSFFYCNLIALVLHS